VSPRALLGLALAVLAASGCGLKGPLFLPEKSEVTIRPAPATTAPETPPQPATADEQKAAPEPTSQPEQPPQDPPPGQDRG
jgi:predicted small lipoprotein YifL